MGLGSAIAAGILAVSAIPDPLGLEVAKANVAVKLRDYKSAEFSNVHFVDSKLICGSVNAKNGYGGFQGYVEFAAYSLPSTSDLTSIVATSYDELFEVIIGYNDRMLRAVRELCRKD